MYMLDTDICSYVLKTKSEKLAKKFESEFGRIAISQIVLAELRFGADNHQNRTQELHELIDDFIARLEIIPWAASLEYGRIRSYLKHNGTPIGSLDMLIAAHALNQDATMVTNNNKHFGKVPKLRIENWM
jgi:tRNA(fMet)-specific endonuclease VapC